MGGRGRNVSLLYNCKRGKGKNGISQRERERERERATSYHREVSVLGMAVVTYNIT
jgi:hypothetical protein